MPSSGFTGPSARPSCAVVLRRDADDDAGVGVALVARVLAHAVGDDAARLRRRRHHRAARAHAEAVDGAAVARVVHELVVGRAEDRVAGVRAEAGAVDQRLRMLDAEADRERLGLHVHAALVQHREGVARAVAERQHDVVGGAAPRRRRASTPRTCARTAPPSITHVDDALREADLAAQRLDLGAHLLDHADEAEGADVRLADVEDLFRRAGLDELGRAPCASGGAGR